MPNNKTGNNGTNNHNHSKSSSPRETIKKHFTQDKEIRHSIKFEQPGTKNDKKFDISPKKD